ncbi:MAG TPA: TonB-dependent receptor [Gemmatimonadaceae bacterium]|nr:TonB-dependent receptor [Gemmatimonadaceae bacterium]
MAFPLALRCAAGALILGTVALGAQDTTGARSRLTVVARHDSAPVFGALVRAGRAAASTDSGGRAVLRLAPGVHDVIVSRIGLRPDTITVSTAANVDTSIVVELAAAPAVISSVLVTSTRVERRLEQEPLRIEVLSGDDVTEKNEMRPGDLKTLFSEMSGVRVQTTSPSLGAATVRVQGLPGRYTTVLNDGLPLYGTHASSFGLVEQPPRDLRQAEVIKGAASALYGPAALGGVVNLVSRRPPDTTQALVNQTAHGGSDALAFVAQRISMHTGLTILGGAHYQRAADPDKDAWTDVAGYHRVELRPRVFYDDSAGHAFMLTAGGFDETRGGGPTGALASPLARTLLDSLATRHADAGGTGSWRLSPAWTLGARAAGNVQSRDRLFAGNAERERQHTLFGELTATGASAANTLVAGLSWQQEGYRNRQAARFDQTLTTPAVFVQHTWTPASWMASTVNGRCDFSNQYGTICTPRVSLLGKVGAALSVRGSVGGGWFAPMALDDETETIGLTRVSLPAPLQPERARTASLDVTATHGPLQVNGTVFQDRVNRPVALRPLAGDTTGAVALVNAPGTLRTQGGELFAVYNLEPVVATAYYAVTHTRELSPETGRPREVPYTPREEAGIDFAIEDDESGAYVAAEVFYTGVQSLEDNPYRALSRPYTTVGILAAKRIARTTVFLNLDNLTNVLQTRFDPILRPAESPAGEGGTRTVAPWAPLEGRSANLGVRYSF